jgi:hypothetical protein
LGNYTEQDAGRLLPYSDDLVSGGRVSSISAAGCRWATSTTCCFQATGACGRRYGRSSISLWSTPPRPLWVKQCHSASPPSDLATKHSNDFRAILGTRWFQQAFSGTRISRTKNTKGEVATTANGCRLATSIDGTLTGRGGDIVLIDDPSNPRTPCPIRSASASMTGTTTPFCRVSTTSSTAASLS